MKIAWISLGSNLGDRQKIMEEAMRRLEPLSQSPLIRSSWWESEPVNCPSGSPPFINAVAGLAPFPAENPESLLEKLRRIEKDLGRGEKKVANEPRPLDLDLVAFDQELRHSEALTLPHPRARHRRFVLGPLAEVAPHYRLPLETKSVSELLAELAPIPWAQPL